eukprot:m.153467 g.153467  ORF g.153467 m.153467 type:complete len:736 (+) comp14293_c0_seq3:105-2312(+)
MAGLSSKQYAKLVATAASTEANSSVVSEASRAKVVELRQACLVILSEQDTENPELQKACDLCSSFALLADNGHRMPDPDMQQASVEIIPLVIASATCGKTVMGQGAAWRTLGNLAYTRSFVAPDTAARDLVDRGVVVSAGKCLKSTHYCGSAPERKLRREAARFLNSISVHYFAQLELMSEEVLPQMLLELGRASSDQCEDSTIGMCVGAVTHMSFYEESQERLMSCGLVDALKPIAFSKRQEHKFVRAILGIASLMGQEEGYSKMATCDYMLASVQGALVAASEGKPYPPQSNTFDRVEHVLVGVDALAGNETNKVKMLENGTVDYLIHLVKTHPGCPILTSRLVSAMWKLSFNDRVRKRYEEHVDLVAHLQAIKHAQQTTDKTKKAIAGILWHLKQDEQRHNDELQSGAKGSSISMTLDRAEGSQAHGHSSATDPEDDVNARVRANTTTRQPVHVAIAGDVPQVMLSYSWATQDIVKRAANTLRAAGIKVWLDLDDLTGSTLGAMAEAVESSALVVVFVCKAYKDSPNCRVEAEYAFQLQKPIIPVKVERYTADGWLGALLGSKLWYEIFPQERYDSTMAALIKSIRADLKISAQPKPQIVDDGSMSIATDAAQEQKPTSTVPSSMTASTVVDPLMASMLVVDAVSNWGASEVATWLASNSLSALESLFHTNSLYHGAFAALVLSARERSPFEFTSDLKTSLSKASRVSIPSLMALAVALRRIQPNTDGPKSS